MSQLDDAYTREIDRAVEKAKASGRFELSDYLSLRTSNDALREEAVKWLFDTATEIVAAFNRRGANITVEHQDYHKFLCCGSSLTGSLLKLSHGLRHLSFEAGWTQSTSDGIMRGGALVCARISHFGFSRHNEELVLLRYEDSPQWFAVAGERERVSFNVQSYKKHFSVFLG